MLHRIVWSYVVAAGLAVGAKLKSGRTAMQQGKTALLAANPSGASRAFGAAERDFSSAAASSRSALLRIIGAIPFVGRTPDAVTAIAGAGVDTATAGKTFMWSAVAKGARTAFIAIGGTALLRTSRKKWA